MAYYQQGDAIITPINELPKDLIEAKDMVVVEGLNRHIAEGPCVKVYKGFISASEPFVIKHPEHKEIVLDAGNYEIKQVLEYSHFDEESRNVVD
jgi:hypothetical protein